MSAGCKTGICIAFLTLPFAKEQPEQLQQFLSLSENLPMKSCTAKVDGILALPLYLLALQRSLHFLQSDYSFFFSTFWDKQAISKGDRG